MTFFAALIYATPPAFLAVLLVYVVRAAVGLARDGDLWRWSTWGIGGDES